MIQAFFKGGVGCLVVFFLLALVASLLGGSATLDCGGSVLLFGLGGVLGVAVYLVYDKGRRDEQTRDDGSGPTDAGATPGISG